MIVACACIAAALLLHLWLLRQPLRGDASDRPATPHIDAPIVHLRLDVAPAPMPETPPSTVPTSPPHDLPTARREDRAPHLGTMRPDPRAPDRASAIDNGAHATPSAVGLPPTTGAVGQLGPSEAPLDLQWHAPPRGRATAEAPSTRSQALGDPRSNDRLSPSERFAAQVSGVEGTIVEPMADGAVRIRSGTGCVIARPSQAATLDPFNTAIRPVPRLVGACP